MRYKQIYKSTDRGLVIFKKQSIVIAFSKHRCCKTDAIRDVTFINFDRWIETPLKLSNYVEISTPFHLMIQQIIVCDYINQKKT